MRDFRNVDEYQNKINEFAIYPRGEALLYLTAGLGSEAGEVLGKVKKRVRDGEGPQYIEDIRAELGDVMWYASQLATLHNIKMSDVLNYNVEKLSSRTARGRIRGNGDTR